MAIRRQRCDLNRHGPAPLDLELPSTVQRVVDWHLWRDAYSKIDPSVERDTAKLDRRLKSAMKRAGEVLLEHGVIGRSNPWVWVTGRPVQGFPETYPKLRTIAGSGNDEPVYGVDDF